MGQVGIVTRVSAGRADALKTYLSTGLPRDMPPTEDGPGRVPTSPFSGVLPPTHFARFVVIELDSEPYLFFTSCFDADTRDYLRALAATPQALTIWGHCQISEADTALTTTELSRYLCDARHWHPTQYLVSAIPSGATLGQINRALSLRDQLSGLIARAASLDPPALAHNFRQLPAVQTLLRR
jgi:hypothetical protein